jgi:hypothetical protein
MISLSTFYMILKKQDIGQKYFRELMMKISIVGATAGFSPVFFSMV